MSHYVYFIQGKGEGNMPVKIGYSNDPEARCKTLQTANFTKLKVRLKLPFESEKLAREAERTFQSLAKRTHKSLHGEWFVIYGCWKHFVSQAMKIFDGNNPK